MYRMYEVKRCQCVHNAFNVWEAPGLATGSPRHERPGVTSAIAVLMCKGTRALRD